MLTFAFLKSGWDPERNSPFTPALWRRARAPASSPFVLMAAMRSSCGSSGGRALLLDRGLVHAGRVVVADFLVHRAALGIRRRRRLEDLAQRRLVALGQLVEASVAGAIGGHRVALEPSAAGELVEVVAGLDGTVEGGGIEARHRARLVQVGGVGGRRSGGRLRRGAAGGHRRHDGQAGGDDEDSLTHAISLPCQFNVRCG